ncbi:hypothetical protein [Cupriavidus campinensis]|uniref:Uncharacterized protein n=1 Tax=Cupriavidus campinensis TaxID=151783 RepID=A0AAE9I6S5_9BURK|nr:hypothetical protein [Cupriavidus campinensis]URF05061.1 hypothetical protein M5D45_04275 [Cupriavidus campinensis]
MSDARTSFDAFYRSLPEHIGGDVDVSPCARPCNKSPKTAHKRWLQAMRPYTVSIFWLMWLFLTKGEDAARRAYQKLGAERKDLVKIGFQVVFEKRHRAKPGFAYHRPEMFVGVSAKDGDFPVRTVRNMRVDTYRRLVEMGEAPV